jgi:hypothetical protein
MALIFLVQRILLHEAVEIAGARKYVEHNMQGASRLQRNQQYCQRMAVTEGTDMVMVAFSATNYKRYHKRAQYEPEHIRWEMRKCLAALALPPNFPLCRRSCVTGCWGCGVFCGDVELKFMIQWMRCSLEPSLKQMIFCPFINQAELDNSGFLDKLVGNLTGKVQAKRVLDLLLGPT